MNFGPQVFCVACNTPLHSHFEGDDDGDGDDDFGMRAEIRTELGQSLKNGRLSLVLTFTQQKLP
eukprot:1156566-Pelagomonas_calceolata.AAC.2